MSTTSIVPARRALTPRDAELLRHARSGALPGHLRADTGQDTARVAELQQLGLIGAGAGLTGDGEAVLARREAPVTVEVTAEAARWLSRHLHRCHHQLTGHDADLALDVRDAANLAVTRHERPGATSEYLLRHRGAL